MGLFKRKPAKDVVVTTLIGTGTRIEHDKLIVDQGIHIDGYVGISIVSSGRADTTVVVSEDGVVEGDVSTHNAVISGVVRGNLSATGSVILASTAEVSGDVTYGTLEQEEGARVRGLKRESVTSLPETH